MKIASMKFSEKHLKHIGKMSKKHNMKPADYIRNLIEQDIRKNIAPFGNLNTK